MEPLGQKILFAIFCEFVNLSIVPDCCSMWLWVLPTACLDREKAAKSDIEALQYTGPTWMNVSMRELIAVLLLQRMGLAIIFLLEVPLLSSSRWTRRSSLDMKLEKPCVDFPKPPGVIASPLHFSGMAWRYHPISWPTKQNCTCCWASYWLWGNCKALLAYFALWELMLYFSTLSNPGWTIILHFKRQDHGSYSLRFHFLELTYIEIQARHWHSTSNLGTPVIDRFAIHDIQIPVGLPWLL